MVTPATDSPAAGVERLPWSQVRDYFLEAHKLGEHVAAEGPNGSGKSLLMLELLKARGERQTVAGRPVSISILEGKTRDKTISALLGKGSDWTRITSLKQWPPAYGEEHTVVWPLGGTKGIANQRVVFRSVLEEIFDSGNQIVYVDEAAYFEAPKPEGLGLGGTLDRYWREARSAGVSLFAGTQRPVRVSRSMWSEPYWLFLFRPEDEDDLKRVAGLSGQKALVLEVLPTLGPHEFLMIRRRPERLAVISQVDELA